jgi:nitrilase
VGEEGVGGAAGRWGEGRWHERGAGADSEGDGGFSRGGVGGAVCGDIVLWCCVCVSKAGCCWEEEEGYARRFFLVPSLLSWFYKVSKADREKTATERLIWGQGSPSSLRAINTIIRGVRLTLAAAICWENYMPLLRQSLYSQNVNLYLAPTADGRDTWEALMRTVACEGRCVVLSANQCIRQGNLPVWIAGEEKDVGMNGNGSSNVTGFVKEKAVHARRKSMIIENGHEIALPDPIPEESKNDGSPKAPRLRRRSTIIEDGHEIVLPSTASNEAIEEHTERKPGSSEFASRGGSCIVSPSGQVLAGPLWDDDDGLLTVEVDFEDCIRGRLDLDVGGSYSRYVLVSSLISGSEYAQLILRRNEFKLTVEGLDLSPPP